MPHVFVNKEWPCPLSILINIHVAFQVITHCHVSKASRHVPNLEINCVALSLSPHVTCENLRNVNRTMMTMTILWAIPSRRFRKCQLATTHPVAQGFQMPNQYAISKGLSPLESAIISENGPLSADSSADHTKIAYCERRYFRAAKFLRIKPYLTFLLGHIFAHFVPNSVYPITI